MTEKTRGQRDELIAHKRAYGSITASMDEDVERVKEKTRELAEARRRLNARYVSAVERRSALAAGGEDPGPILSPAARVGVIELPMLREYPPRKRISLRRTPEQLKREEDKRKREAEEYERVTRSLPNLGGLGADVPLGQI